MYGLHVQTTDRELSTINLYFQPLTKLNAHGCGCTRKGPCVRHEYQIVDFDTGIYLKMSSLLLQGRNALLHLLECGAHTTERGLLNALEAVELQYVVVEAHERSHGLSLVLKHDLWTHFLAHCLAIAMRHLDKAIVAFP